MKDDFLNCDLENFYYYDLLNNVGSKYCYIESNNEFPKFKTAIDRLPEAKSDK